MDHTVPDGPECQHLCKVIFVGAAGVGKTCLMERLFTDSFNAQTQPTIGCEFRFKRYMIDNKNIGVTLWDTAGAERYAALTANYFRGAHGVVLVFDVSRRETLDALRDHWIPEVGKYQTHPDVVKLIVGNKTDLEGSREVSREEATAFARDHGCLYHETSAKIPGDNVHDALVWGLLVNIVDNPALLRAQDFERLQLEAAANQQQQQQQRSKPGCCG